MADLAWLILRQAEVRQGRYAVALTGVQNNRVSNCSRVIR
jgi:hypothetical protein